MIDDYRKLQTTEKDNLFTELFELKEQKKTLDDRIKEIEKQYKPDQVGLQNDIFYELDNGTRFSIKASKRKGSIDTKAMESDGIDVESYRKAETTIHTLRKDKQ